MRYVLKQKFWSWGDDFRIQDADGKDVFFVDGRAFSWGDKLSFQDLEKNELAFIRQKLLAWGPTYDRRGHRHGLPSGKQTRLEKWGRSVGACAATNLRNQMNPFGQSWFLRYRSVAARKYPQVSIFEATSRETGARMLK